MARLTAAAARASRRAAASTEAAKLFFALDLQRSIDEVGVLKVLLGGVGIQKPFSTDQLEVRSWIGLTMPVQAWSAPISVLRSAVSKAVDGLARIPTMLKV